ncbi:MAG TPA: hypothetical protein P5141_12375 [Candidatus Hydrogenedentes bacterium]|nr:hypothetical protein [Candidatus Hydrogenedentota bacterium]
MSIRFPKGCRTRAERSAHAARVARARWERVHAGETTERKRRVLLVLGVHRPAVDGRAAVVEIVDDGVHRRREFVEDGRKAKGVYSRKALLRWFGAVLESAGV